MVRRRGARKGRRKRTKSRQKRSHRGLLPAAALIPGLLAMGKAAGLGAVGAFGAAGARKAMSTIKNRRKKKR